MVDLALLQSVSYIAGALGVCVAAIYYVMNLRVQQTNMKNTLETRKADILQRHAQMFISKDFMTAWVDVVFHQHYLTYEEWQQKYGPDINPEAYAHSGQVVQYYETLGGLLRENLVSVELIKITWQPLHLVCVWGRVEPVIKGWRKTYKDESIYSNIEWLFNKFMEIYPEMSLSYQVFHDQKIRMYSSKAETP